jgi:methylated-DNA-[protein]-cysteine S-methyltransferase
MGNYFGYEYPVGKIWIAEEDGNITQLRFGKPKKSDVVGLEEKESKVIKLAKKQLDQYFAGKRKDFELPLAPAGTAFRQKVWKALQTIPYGKTKSYGEIAKKIKNEKATRAVGGANHNNPISIVIPCHRVIGSDGSLTGYGGGLKAKQYLLDLEQGKL